MQDGKVKNTASDSGVGRLTNFWRISGYCPRSPEHLIRRREVWASLECVGVNHGLLASFFEYLDVFQGRAVSERPFVDASNALGQHHSGEIGASLKHAFANPTDALGYVDFRQIDAVLKQAFVKRLQALGESWIGHDN